MRALVLVTLLAGSAFADPRPAPAPIARPRVVQPRAVPKPTPSACKRRVVGRGLDRKVICEVTTEINVSASAPKPNVLIVPREGKVVTGRPRSEDRLRGLGPRL